MGGGGGGRERERKRGWGGGCVCECVCVLVYRSTCVHTACVHALCVCVNLCLSANTGWFAIISCKDNLFLMVLRSRVHWMIILSGVNCNIPIFRYGT